MKRILTLVFLVILVTNIFSPVFAEARYDGMTLEELNQESIAILNAMWKNEEWQKVLVPAGVYKVGEEISAGEWTITPADSYIYVQVGTKLDSTHTQIDSDSYVAGEVFDSEDRINGWTVRLLEGYYITLNYSAYFTPPVKGLNFTFK